MARIRTIKPEFWEDVKIARVTRDARLLYIGMWNFADDLGVIIGDHPWIKSKIFPLDQIQNQQFDKWIEELVKPGFISLLSLNGERFYYLPNLTRHQKIDRPNHDRVNIQKDDLQCILATPEQSPNNRRTFDEQSPPIRGEDKEGNKIGDTPPIIPPPGDGDSAVTDAVIPMVVDLELCMVYGDEWRKDFTAYKSGLRQCYGALIKNAEWLAERKRLNPGINIPLTLEKCCVDFWATEAGWENKKKGKSKSIDWKQTLAKSVGAKFNHVYENGTRTNQTGRNTVSDEFRAEVLRGMGAI